MKVKFAHSCPTLCYAVNYTVDGILQVRTLEPFPSPADLPNPGIKPRSPSLQADSLLSEPPGEALLDKIIYNILSERCFCLAS